MYNEPIFLEPVFKEKLWGGSKLKEYFKYEIASNKIGECWGISAHPKGPSYVKNGPLKGKKLNQLWDENKELFGNVSGDKFPLLVKIIDANQNLSVQVHPDDHYASIHENGELGKTECWYIIDCVPGAEVILGHNALNREEFVSKINNDQWDQLLKKVPIKPGDFFYVPSGTIHAIGEGTLILETQQSSDTTYRIYDFKRVDKKGNQRELHLQQSLDVATIPHKNLILNQETSLEGGLLTKKLISEEFFTVFHCDLDGTVEKKRERNYLLISVIDGNGYIRINEVPYRFKKGDHLIIPATVSYYKLSGKAQFILSYPGN